MKTIKVLVLLLAAVAAGYLGGYATSLKSNTTPTASIHETAYQRVMRTGILRCGYFVEPPFTILNNDNSITGIARDLTIHITNELGLRLEWGETNFSTLADDLKNGRYDAICASVFALARHGRVDYTIPYAIVPVYGYARADDTRFDRSLLEIDWSKITVSGLDGEGATAAAQKILPQAKFDILPQSLQIADMLGSVVYKKADIGFVQPSVFEKFDANNKGVLKKALLGASLYDYAVVFAVAPEEQGLKSMLNNMILQLKTSGELATMIDKYDPEKFVTRP